LSARSLTYSTSWNRGRKLLIAILRFDGKPFSQNHWPKPIIVKGISLKRIVMIALEPLRAPQAIHAACVSLP